MTARVAALLVAVALVAAGCGGTGTDDELQPRTAPTVTVTAAPQQRLADRLDLSGSGDVTAGSVVWALDETLHVGDRTVDLASVVPEQVVVLDRGVLVRSGEQVYLVSGREVAGLALPPVRSLDVSDDGSQVVVRTTDRTEPVGYTLDGALVTAGEVRPARSERRTTRGPGEVAVVEGRVVGPQGGLVPVADLPTDLEVRGWTSASAFYGTGRTTGEAPGRTALVACVLGTGAACSEVGEVPTDRLDDVVLGQHPDG